MFGISLFKKKCELCGRSALLEAEVPVPGYTEKQKRHFCSEEHTRSYSERARIIIENSPRLCGKC